jgi:DNA-binding FadR family transcriptional regulator
MDIVSTLGRVSRERTGALRDVREAALRDHRRLLEALRARDPDAAERAMLDHLDHVEEGLRSAIGSEDAGPVVNVAEPAEGAAPVAAEGRAP